MDTRSWSMMDQHVKDVIIAAKSLSGNFFMVKYFQSALIWQNLGHVRKASKLSFKDNLKCQIMRNASEIDLKICR
jgi:hypothetical protein